MKKSIILITILIISIFHPISGQEPDNVNTKQEIQFNPNTATFDSGIVKPVINKNIGYNTSDFNCNCLTDFWTVTPEGEIQQWSLNDNSISGGSIVLTGSSAGLAYCGDPDYFTFYSGMTDTGILYYDSIAGWTEITTQYWVNNNGGFLDNQYYQGIGNNNPFCRILYYLKGNDIFMVDSLADLQYTVADIAVDSLGQAWTFVGETWDSNESIYVYNQSGFVKSYDINFNSNNGYGSTFINDTLYIGFGLSNPIYPGKLVPVFVDNNTAQLGPAISFPYHMYDLASCRCVGPIVGLGEEPFSDSYINIFPNPTAGSINISNLERPANYRILNLDGNLVMEGLVESNRVNVEELTAGVYFLELLAGEHKVIRKIIKK